jgi:hypothetical protein
MVQSSIVNGRRPFLHSTTGNRPSRSRQRWSGPSPSCLSGRWDRMPIALPRSSAACSNFSAPPGNRASKARLTPLRLPRFQARSDRYPRCLSLVGQTAENIANGVAPKSATDGAGAAIPMHVLQTVPRNFSFIRRTSNKAAKGSFVANRAA